MLILPPAAPLLATLVQRLDIIGAQECLLKVFSNAWEKHIFQSLNCLFLLACFSFCLSRNNEKIALGYIPNPVHGF